MKTLSTRAAAVTAAVSFLGLGAGSAAAEPFDYGPPPVPAPISFPGGNTSVVTSATVGPEGRTLRGRTQTASITLDVPPRTLSSQLQLIVTAPRIAPVRSRLARQGVQGRVLTTIEVNALKQDGTLVRGRLARGMVTMILRARSLTRNARVMRWDSRLGRYVAVPADRIQIRAGIVSVRLNRPWQLVILAPAR